ncbi:MAG: hypothetical protein PHF67_01625, partial [Candidatus Nanoarchaeia archaeon]|nr:hypothetical protein [Candidatus Nanoarchaeia archaeon]
MVYKKYIKRNNKIFGPYYYESHRDKKGRVISKFVSGPTKKDELLNKITPNINKNFKKIIEGVLFGFVAFFMIVLFFILALGLNNFSKTSGFAIIENQNIVQKLDTFSTNLAAYLDGLIDIKNYSKNIEQTNIIKAEHFDSSRTSLRDITDSVIQKDDLWSLVNPGEYVRAYFEKNLTNKNDITLFAKSISMDGSKIEVYNKDSNDLIAVFNKIGKESNYKTYLRGIPDGESYDAFDLKVLNNPVQFDYITDPETPP